MTTLRAWLVRLRSMARRRAAEREIAEEIASNVELHVADGIRDGLTPGEARRRALVRFGGIEQTKEAWRDQAGFPFIETLWKDVVYAVRMMGRNRSWTGVAVLSLALGIGVNTALFSFVHAWFLEPLPVRAPQELVAFRWEGPNNTQNGEGWGLEINRANEYPPTRGGFLPITALEPMQRANETLDALFGVHQGRDAEIEMNGSSDTATTQYVTGDFYRGLGIAMPLGRSLIPDDDRADAEVAVVISDGYWTRRFGRDAGVLGRRIAVNGTPATIVGVEPGGLSSVLGRGEVRRAPDVTIPLAFQPRVEGGYARSIFDEPYFWQVLFMGRLRQGVSMEAARRNLEPAFVEGARQSALRFAPEVLEIPRLVLVSASRGASDVPDRVRDGLILPAAIFGIVLLLVVVNVANLMLSRTENRHDEIAVRMAIGAGRWRIMRQLLTESLLLAGLGGVSGLLVASGANTLLGALTRETHSLDPTALLIALAISISSGILFGFAPAWRAVRNEGRNPIYERQGGGTRSRSWMGSSLVVVQVALSLVLLVSAGLLVGTLYNLMTVDSGFDDDALIIGSLASTAAAPIDETGDSSSVEEQHRGFELIRQGLADSPNVRAVSFSFPLPIFDVMPGETISTDEAGPIGAGSLRVHPSFFETLDIPILAGRAFGPGDGPGSRPVAVVNETAARRLFADRNPVGEILHVEDEAGFEIVGVVGDTKYGSIRADTQPLVFFDYRQRGSLELGVTLSIQPRGNPEALLPAIQEAFDAVLLPGFRAGPLSPLRQRKAIDRNQEQLHAATGVFFGVLALIIAAVGLFGLMSYTVARRTKEIGIRMALGAQRRTVIRATMRESLTLVAVGIILGTGAALATTRLIERLLFGLTPTDSRAIIGAIVLMLAVSALAGFLPARRAARVDPMIALRHD